MRENPKRPTISPALKVAALLHRVYLQFGEYLKCPISGEPMTPEDRIQFDHTHCVELGGPNVYDNLRPVLVAPHQKKTKADMRMIKKARPGHAGKFQVVKELGGIAEGREALTRTRACDGGLGVPTGSIEGPFLDHETGVMSADTSRCVGKFQSRQPVLKPGPPKPKRKIPKRQDPWGTEYRARKASA